MTFWNFVFGGMAVALWTAMFFEVGTQWGYKRGRKDEANWWIGVEKQTDRAAQEIARGER